VRIIPVTNYPLKSSYGSFEAAIEGATRNPLQPKAQADSENLAGTTVVDAYWNDVEFAIRFSNERFLHIWACPGEVGWEIVEDPPVVDESDVQRVGAEPVIHRWAAPLVDEVKDCSTLVCKRRGAEFQRLFVNEIGLLVYCRRRLIWRFAAVRREDRDQPILSVSEGD
jgi:hypothetical protein